MKNKVAGISFQEENVLLLARENDDYSLPKKALLEEYYDGDRVYKFDFHLANKAKLVREPDNPHDPKAVAVYAQHPLTMEWLKIGYVKAGSTGRVNPDVLYSLEISGGPYKDITTDDDDEPAVKSGELPFFASFEEMDPGENKAPAISEEKREEAPKKSKKTALLLCIFLGFLGAHKFYEGKAGMGILYLFTAGLFIFGWITDIFKLIKYPERF